MSILLTAQYINLGGLLELVPQRHLKSWLEPRFFARMALRFHKMYTRWLVSAKIFSKTALHVPENCIPLRWSLFSSMACVASKNSSQSF